MNNRKGNLGVSLKINRLPEPHLKYCATGTLTTELGIIYTCKNALVDMPRLNFCRKLVITNT